MELNKCLGCMEDFRGYPCPKCSYDPQKETGREYALPLQTILAGKYLIGRVLGQGGFGITYIGWDIALERKVAVKEYYPNGQANRAPGTRSLSWYTSESAQAARQAGMEMFLKEARKMAKVEDIPGVVKVRELFRENETAYIVMDFVEGETLKARLKRTGPMPWAQAKAIFHPAIQAMEKVHQAGLIHRDLSPDNIMLTPNGQVKILDLGAAKDLSVNSGASSMQVAKGGFSPFEQYTQRGGSGPWTDVYAMAATIYFTLTGKTPPAAMDRVEEDTISWNLPGLDALPASALSALQKALAVTAKKRTQSMEELEKGLFDEVPQPEPEPNPKPELKPEPKPEPAQREEHSSTAAQKGLKWWLGPTQELLPFQDKLANRWFLVVAFACLLVLALPAENYETLSNNGMLSSIYRGHLPFSWSILAGAALGGSVCLFAMCGPLLSFLCCGALCYLKAENGEDIYYDFLLISMLVSLGTKGIYWQRRKACQSLNMRLVMSVFLYGIILFVGCMDIRNFVEGFFFGKHKVWYYIDFTWPTRLEILAIAAAFFSLFFWGSAAIQKVESNAPPKSTSEKWWLGFSTELLPSARWMQILLLILGVFGITAIADGVSVVCIYFFFGIFTMMALLFGPGVGLPFIALNCVRFGYINYELLLIIAVPIFVIGIAEKCVLYAAKKISPYTTAGICAIMNAIGSLLLLRVFIAMGFEKPVNGFTVFAIALFVNLLLLIALTAFKNALGKAAGKKP